MWKRLVISLLLLLALSPIYSVDVGQQTDEQLWTKLESLISEQQKDLTTALSEQTRLSDEVTNLKLDLTTVSNELTISKQELMLTKNDLKTASNEVKKSQTLFTNYVKEQKVKTTQTILISFGIGFITGVLVHAIL